ncbi:MAG: WecB/TagA/CpsF family glycosyltransferase [candidate division WOR-3 bacterium]
MILHNTNRKKVFGVPVDTIDLKNILENIHYFVQNDIKQNNIMAVNAEKIMAAQKDKFLLDCLEKATFLIPDGAGATVALKVIHSIKPERIPGADLMHYICQESAKSGYKIFIYGATEESNQKAVERLKELYPGINIVGRSNGYVNEERMDELVKMINDSKAQILFVALGSPKQEKWIARYLPRLNVNICQGVGGTLDTIAGTVKRAPYFFRKTGTEWIYRLIKQPRRIRRHIAIWIFIFRVIKIWVKKKLKF